MSLPPHGPLDRRRVRLEKLAEAHAAALFDTLHGEDTWLYLPVGPFPSRAAFDEYFAAKTKARDSLNYAIVEKAGGRAAGMVSLMRFDPPHRVVETGAIALSPALQRTAAATEGHFLLARHVFETLGYRRYEWKCDNGNERSKRAALRLGFRFEGVFRQHMLVKGRNRDTAWFSMLDGEWPERKAAFLAWLDPANFDEEGRQKRALADCRA